MLFPTALTTKVVNTAMAN